VTGVPDDAWFATHTVGAPEELRARSERFFRQATADGLVARLSNAGRAALAEAVRDGAARSAALDLLAGDALITLALLRAAEENPATLEHAAAELRRQATRSA
jgi:hypothetical protein